MPGNKASPVDRQYRNSVMLCKARCQRDACLHRWMSPGAQATANPAATLGAWRHIRLHRRLWLHVSLPGMGQAVTTVQQRGILLQAAFAALSALKPAAAAAVADTTSVFVCVANHSTPLPSRSGAT